MMVYDYDLKWTNRVIWFMLGVHAVGVITSVYRHRWGVAFGFLIWGANLWLWRGVNRSLQVQRDRNREVEAAMMKVLIDQWRN